MWRTHQQFNNLIYNIMSDVTQKIPSEIKIGNRKITVEFKNFDGEEFKGVMGFYDSMNFAIVIDGNLRETNPTQIVETFWHELIHAINHSIRFNQELFEEMNDKDTIDEDVWKFQEKFTENFARTFLQVIQDNDLLPISE